MPVSSDTGIFVYAIQDEACNQGSLLPMSLNELVPDDHWVRVIEADVARLDLCAMSLSKNRRGTQRMIRRTCSSYIFTTTFNAFARRAGRAECQRNVEVMWLLGRLAPDFKT